MPYSSSDDQTGTPVLRFDFGDAEKLRTVLEKAVMERVVYLAMEGNDDAANALLEEFDQPKLWDDACTQKIP